MPRPKTKPPKSSAELRQQELRRLVKRHKGDGTQIAGTCNDMIGMIRNILAYSAAGDLKGAMAVSRNLERSTKALAKQLAKINDQ